MRTAEEIMANNGNFNSGSTINVIDDQQNKELYDMFWGGIEAGKQALDRAGQTLQPGLQRATLNVSLATSEIFEQGVDAPVIKRTTESVKQTVHVVGSAAKEAGTNAYNKIDEISGGNVSAVAQKATEAAWSSFNLVKGFGSSFFG